MAHLNIILVDFCIRLQIPKYKRLLISWFQNIALIFLLLFQAITFIFKSLGVKGVGYLAQVVPSLLTVIRTSDPTFRDFLFQQLASLIGIVKQQIRNYLDGIIEVLKVRQHVVTCLLVLIWQNKSLLIMKMGQHIYTFSLWCNVYNDIQSLFKYCLFVSRFVKVFNCQGCFSTVPYVLQ